MGGEGQGLQILHTPLLLLSLGYHTSIGNNVVQNSLIQTPRSLAVVPSSASGSGKRWTGGFCLLFPGHSLSIPLWRSWHNLGKF